MPTDECPGHEGCPAYGQCQADYSDHYDGVHTVIDEEGCPNYGENICPSHYNGVNAVVDEPGCPNHGQCPAYNATEKYGDYTSEKTTDRTEEGGCPEHCPMHGICRTDYAAYDSTEANPCPTHNAAEFADHKGGDFIVYTHPTEPCSVHNSTEAELGLPGAPEFEPYAGEYPTLDIPTYEEYAAQFPSNQLPTYEQYKEQFPQLTLERYQEYGKEYPGLGEMFELSEAGIRQLMSSTGLPVEELMRAYSAEEKAMLDEYLPQLREQWSARGLLRSGGTVKQELKAVGESARKMATTRAELEKESAIFQRQGLEAGIGLAMQHAGMGQQVSADAFRAGQEEYQKAYDTGITAGLNEHQARVQGYNAQIDEHVRQFSSSVESQKFVQGMEEKAYQAGREEWQKVFDSQVAKGLTEFEAEQAAYEAGQAEYARVQQLEFEKWQTEYVEEMKRYLMELGFSAQQAQAAAQGWGNIFGTIIGLLFQWLIGT